MTEAPQPVQSGPEPAALPEAPVLPPPARVAAPQAALARWPWALGAAALVGLLGLMLLWQKVAAMQEQLARQSASAQAEATEARTLAKQAVTLVQDANARLAVQEARLSEVALQRSQLDELMQSLSRSRDENLLVDLESALRLAGEQAQLTGSVAPMLAALKTAEQRIARAAQPRLGLLARAVARDADRIRAAAVSDTPSMLVKLDELARVCDELVLVNAVGRPTSAAHPPARSASAAAPVSAWPAWWPGVWQQVLARAGDLLRISRIDSPEAVLLAPDQAYFLRENLKLRVLNARLAVLARQTDAVRSDLTQVDRMLRRYFDPAARSSQLALKLTAEVAQQTRALQLPRMDGTLGVLATLSAGR